MSARPAPPERRYPLDALRANVGLPAGTGGWGVLAHLGVRSGSHQSRWVAEGVTWQTADRLATLAGRHPAEVWPEWRDDAIERADTERRAVVAARQRRRLATNPAAAEANRARRRAYYAANGDYERGRERRRYHADPDTPRSRRRAEWAARTPERVEADRRNAHARYIRRRDARRAR